MELLDSNPKTRFGMAKPGIANIPPVAILTLGQAMSNGAVKYGRTNWREHEVTASVYYDAIGRHLMAWWDGEEVADDSGIHHLGHAMAGLSILLDAEASDKLIDDRPSVPGMTAAFIAQFTVPMDADKGEPEKVDVYKETTSEEFDASLEASGDDDPPFDLAQELVHRAMEIMLGEIADAAANAIDENGEFQREWAISAIGNALGISMSERLENPLDAIWHSRGDRFDVDQMKVQQALTAAYTLQEVDAVAPVNVAFKHLGQSRLDQLHEHEMITLMFYLDCITAGVPLDLEAWDYYLCDRGVETPTIPL